jgi:hypothetical protein
MATRTYCPEDIPEGVSFRYEAMLTKEDHSPLPYVQLDSLSLTLYALDLNLTIVNGVQDLNILNVNLGTLDSTGHLVIVLRPADTAILDPLNPTEQRIMLIEGTYSGGKATRHEVVLTIRNMALVP